MTTAGRAPDWQQAYAKLERAIQALQTGDALAPDESRRILKERARALATPVETAVARNERRPLLTFTLGAERWGVDITHVVDVLPMRAVTPVPCAPPFVLGVINHRGRVLSILDLRPLLDLAGDGFGKGSQAVVVEAGGMTFGIATHGAIEATEASMEEVAAPGNLTGTRGAFVQGVTPTMIVVVDLEALAHDARMLVNEDVG